MTANRNHPYDMKIIVDQVRQYFGILNRVDATANGALGRSSQAQVIENLRSDFDPAEAKLDSHLTTLVPINPLPCSCCFNQAKIEFCLGPLTSL